MKAILDLCSGSGNWSKPYKDAGYQVIEIDLPTDVRLMPFIKTPIHGILAAPPCTMFSCAAAWMERTDDEYKLALAVVDACLRAVAIYSPSFWALENPTGRLSRWLGKPALIFHPWQYGDPWTKRTALWGHFHLPTRNEVPPQGSVLDKPDCKTASSRKERAKTPLGFANAFFLANP